MIPKQIHYCWFGGGKMPRAVRDCIQTWHKHMPDYKFILWNEQTCSQLPAGIDNPLDHSFVQSAYKAKKYAFVADYVRFWALYHYGGIYLDTDMYVVKSFDNLLSNSCFFGWENQSQKTVGACVIGAEKGHHICEEILNLYDGKIFNNADIPSLIIPQLTTPVLSKSKDVIIFSSDFFYPYTYEQKQLGEKDFLSTVTPNTYAIHLWNLSWSTWYKKLWSKLSYKYKRFRQQMGKPHIIHFINYCPRVYSGMDKWLLVAGKKMKDRCTPVFVYFDNMDSVPQLEKDLLDADILYEFIPDHGKWAQLKATFRLLRKYHPTIVHSHFVNWIKWILAIGRYVFKYNYFVHFHSTIYEGGWHLYAKDNNQVKSWTYKHIFCGLINKASNKVLCVSKAIKSQWDSFASSSKSELLYMGVDVSKTTTRTKARELLSIPQDQLAIVNVSAIEYIKGIDVLIKAIALLKKEGLACHFYHIGGLRKDTPQQKNYADNLKKLVDELNVNDCVSWLGKRLDIMNILPAFDMYVQPSRQEGTPMALVEAAAAGLPMIGSNIGGIPEVVHNGENGLLFEPEYEEALAQCLKQLLANNKQRLQFGAAARETAVKDFNIENQTNKLLAIYEKC